MHTSAVANKILLLSNEVKNDILSEAGKLDCIQLCNVAFAIGSDETVVLVDFENLLFNNFHLEILRV